MFKNYLASLINKIQERSKIQSVMADFGEKLVALKKFERCIKKETFFNSEEIKYKKAYKRHLDKIRRDLNRYLNEYELQ